MVRPPLPLARQPLRPGTAIGGGETLECVGGGRTGLVYRMLDRANDRQFALREYMPLGLAHRVGNDVVPFADAEVAFAQGLHRFVDDANRLAGFDHPALVKSHRVWSIGGSACMALPLLHGRSLAQELRRLPRPLPQARLETWLRGLSEALVCLHRSGTVHGQVSPAQVMVLDSGALVLREFDNARWALGEAQWQRGSDPWLAPEQLDALTAPARPVGAWTDVYALAALMHYAITGRTPVPAAQRSGADPQVPLTAVAGGDYSHRLLRALDRALNLPPQARPQSMVQFMGSLGLVERRTPQDSATPEAGHERRRLKDKGPVVCTTGHLLSSAP